MSLNSPTSLGQAQILSALGQKLRERYEPVVKEPLPENIGALVAQLERATAESDAR
jgi:Anti-sigma factor NepR